MVVNDRENKMQEVNEMIEKDLELVGSTAIEDRLQDKVADTIRFMKRVGIKVWVLTGDKMETAISIGMSTGLLDNNME
jgi:P-type E1-E2 ATPase